MNAQTCEEIFILPLEQRDQYFMKIHQEIEEREKLLLEKQKKLRVISKQNNFLGEVHNDYLNYYEYIIQQKQDQMKALKMLNDYINDLKVAGKLSKQNLEDSKQEQKKILHELKLIKNSLDSIIGSTSDISLTLKEKNII
jgi:hypothetical protein